MVCYQRGLHLYWSFFRTKKSCHDTASFLRKRIVDKSFCVGQDETFRRTLKAGLFCTNAGLKGVCFPPQYSPTLHCANQLTLPHLKVSFSSDGRRTTRQMHLVSTCLRYLVHVIDRCQFISFRHVGRAALRCRMSTLHARRRRRQREKSSIFSVFWSFSHLDVNDERSPLTVGGLVLGFILI